MPEHKVVILFLAQLQVPVVDTVLLEDLRVAVHQPEDPVVLEVAAVVTGVLAEPLLPLDKEMLVVAVEIMVAVQVAEQAALVTEDPNSMVVMAEHQ
jgi:hypothetical protein